MRKQILVLAISISLSACGSTELMVGGLAAAGGIISSMAASPDYALYAEKCREIVQDARDAAFAESQVLTKVAEDKTMGHSILLYMAMKPKTDVFTKCALVMPKGFLASLAESGNILNFVASVYGINRSSINDRKLLEANKELGLANMEHNEDMMRLQNALLGRLADGTIKGVEAGAAAAKP